MFKKILLSLLLLTAVLSATTPTRENVTKLYVATFDRAPDAGGLAYWLDESPLDLEGIAKSFFVQPETKEEYPPGTTTSFFIETVYANLFNRAPDAGGLAYWLADLDSRRISRSVFILAVINGALGDDAVILDHKTEVGLYFAEKGLDDVEDAIRVMADVTEDPATVVAAKKLIDEIAEGEKPPAPTPPNDEFSEGDRIIEMALSKMPSDTEMTEEQLLANLDRIIADLKNDPRVASVEVSADKLDITFTTKSGSYMGISFAIDDGGPKTAGGQFPVPIRESKLPSFQSSNLLGADGGVRYIPATKNKNVLILEPFAVADKWTHEGDDAKEFSDMGFSVTRIGIEASPESFKNWNKYGIIIIRAHGGKNGSLGLSITRTKDLENKYDADNTAQRVLFSTKLVLKVNYTNFQKFFRLINAGPYPVNKRFSIMPSFMQHYAKSKLPDTLIFSEACSGMWPKNPIGAILLKMGAKTVVGFSDVVYIGYGLNIYGEFHNRLLVGKTVEEALNDAKSKYGNNDTDWFNSLTLEDKVDWEDPNLKDDNTPATPVFAGDGNMVIVKEATPPTPGQPSTLKKTGQTTVYADFDDGYYQTGVDTDYVRDDSKEIVKDYVTGLEWQDDEAVKIETMTWYEAGSYCADLQLDIANGVWRLPTIVELQGIVVDGAYNPYIDTSEFLNYTSHSYWSSTTYAANTSHAWFVSFYNGLTSWLDTYVKGKAATRHVRCVRAGQWIVSNDELRMNNTRSIR